MLDLPRHSHAGAGVGAHGIKEVLRHSSVTTTERYLRGFSRDLLDDAYRRAFAGTPGVSTKALSEDGPPSAGGKREAFDDVLDRVPDVEPDDEGRA